MTITQSELDSYHKNGYLVLENFVTNDHCLRLMERAEELITDFDPTNLKTVFSTSDQRHASTRYFLESGDKIHFFF